MDNKEKAELLAAMDASNYAKFNWTALAFAGTVLIAVIGWIFSVESRLVENRASMNLNSRVTNLEEVLMPVLVDLKVRQELEKVENRKKKSIAMVAPGTKAEPSKTPKIEEDAQNWARGQIQQFREEK